MSIELVDLCFYCYKKQEFVENNKCQKVAGPWNLCDTQSLCDGFIRFRKRGAIGTNAV